MKSLLSRIASLWIRPQSSTRKVRQRRQSRRMFLEGLEHRSVMAADNLGAIVGTVYSDLTDNGLTGDDAAVVGATINLYRDGGNGTFNNGGGDDVLVGTRTTDSAGKYRFDGLTAGRYFVQQPLTSGYLQKPNSNVKTINISAADAAGAAGLIIDTFGSNQEVSLQAPPGNVSKSNTTLDSNVLGGERDLFARLSSNSGRILFSSNVTSPSKLEFATTLTAQGVGIVTYDGIDGNGSTLNATGLGGVDLTQGGTMRGLQLTMSSDPNDATGIIRIYKDANKYSTYSFDLPDGGPSVVENVYIPFSAFTNSAGTGADFTSVGAIQMELSGLAGVDGAVDLFTAVGPKEFAANFANYEPLSVGDLVWTDANNDGFYQTTEAVISGVLMNLYADTDKNGVYTPGTDVKLASQSTNAQGKYLFQNLFPDDYVVQVDQSNFTGSGKLVGYAASTGKTVTDPDDNLNNDNNGISLSGQGVVARAVTLAARSEPTNDGDGANSNLTVDFGFFPQVDLQLTKADSVDPGVAGGPLTYTITVKNNGPATSTGVVITDPLPAEVNYVNATSTMGSVTYANGTVTVNVGTLAVNQVVVVTINTTIKESASGTILNAAEVRGNEFETNTTNNRDEEPTPVDPRIDLQITKTDDVDPGIAGGPLVYTLTIRNNGPSRATGVIVNDPLPSSVTYGSATTSKGTVTFTNGTVRGNIGTLAVGEVVTITVNTTIKPGTRGTILNEATVAGNEIETNTANNKDDEPTPVNPIIDLSIDKSDDVDPIIAGEVLTYTLLVRNDGPSTATGVVVTDTLPPNVKTQSITTTQGTFTQTGRTILVTMGTLAPGEQERVTIKVIVDRGFSGRLLNKSKVAAVETETTYANNRDDEPTLVEPIPSSIGGFVYEDLDDDGILDAGEKGIAGVQITLTGLDDTGPVTFVVTTNAQGAYLFTNLRPGTYQIKEGPVAGKYLDGKDTRGTPLLGTASNDLFSAIVLPSDTNARNYNFGEKPDRPTDPEGDPDPPFSKKRYIRRMNWS